MNTVHLDYVISNGFSFFGKLAGRAYESSDGDGTLALVAIIIVVAIAIYVVYKWRNR
jgi:hypothetical protein